MRKIVYIDMDGVVADFDGMMRHLMPDLDSHDQETRSRMVDEKCSLYIGLFQHLDPIVGAIEAVTCLLADPALEVYFLWRVSPQDKYRAAGFPHNFGLNP